MEKPISTILISAILLAGCASAADEITPSYVSPIIYKNYGCDELALEAQRVSMHAAKAAGVQDDAASNDAVATGVGVILFWPALFMMKGDGANAHELARLRGQMDAVEQASIQKKCNIQFAKPKQIKKKQEEDFSRDYDS